MADLCPRVTSVESVGKPCKRQGACIVEGRETTREAARALPRRLFEGDASIKSCWPGNLNRATPRQELMESLEESSAAKHQHLTRRDVQQTMQTGGPSSVKIELADGVKVKKEKSPEQEISFERQDQGEMELDDFWLRVKGEIKEEIEQEEQEEHACKSSSLDDLTPEEIMMKEEMEEDPKHDEAFESLQSQSDHSAVATQERDIEKSNKAANSQTAAEPEPKPVAKRRRLTRRDVQQTMQTGGPSSVKIELADGVKVKKEKSPEQEISFESQDKGEMELDDFWLRVKGEIKEEIEQEEQEEHACKASSLDDLTPEEIMMKEEMEEDPKHDEAFESLQSQSDHSEVATQERDIEKSNKAANSQAAAEPEPKPVAKRRRLTRRDVQQTMQTGGQSSVKIELADGVKVKKEKSAEQEISFDRQDKEKMELDDLWLKVHNKVNEQSLMTFAAANAAAENALNPPESKSGTGQVQTSAQQQLEPRACGMEDASKSKADEDLASPEESPLDAFASHAASWAKQCLAFRSSKTWSPTRPCCPANIFLGSANGTPSPPPTDAPACVLRLTGHGLRCLQRFHEKQGLQSMTFQSQAEASQTPRDMLPQEPPLDCDLSMQDYKVRGLDCMKMWPWMRDLPTSVWAGHGWAFDENGLRRLSSSGGSHAMQGVEVFESVGLAAEQVKPSDEKIKAPISVAAECPPPLAEGQKPSQFKRINVAKQSGVPNVVWHNTMQSWCVNFCERDAKGQKTRQTGRKFSVKNFMGPGISEAQADAAALEAAKAFRAELVEKGILSEPKQKDPNFTSEVPGVKWYKIHQKWRVRICPGGGKKIISGGLFTEKAAAEAKALELREKDGLQRQVKPVATLSELPMFHPKVPYLGVRWEQRSQQWHAQCRVAGANRHFTVKPKDHSEAELERSFQVAVAWRRKQEKEKEKESKAVKSKVKPGRKQRK